MVSKKVKSRLHTFLLVLVIIILAVIAIFSGGANSGGGCCSSCGGCCGDDDFEDTDMDDIEDTPPAPEPEPGPTVCDTKGLSETHVSGTFKQTELATTFEYTYTFNIIACKQTIQYSVRMKGLKEMDADTGSVAFESELSRSGTVFSEQIPNFERDDVFDQMCIKVSDPSIGEVCYEES